MKYAWASITKGCTNFGNYQIEYTLKNLLQQEGLKTEPSFIFDAFSVQNTDTIEKINALDFLIISGCTTLTIKHYPGIKSILEQIKVPIYNLGAAFFGEPDAESLAYYQYFYQPIGTRDPISSQYLSDNQVANILIGCPTLFSGEAQKFQVRSNKKIVCIFGLKETQKQQKIVEQLLKQDYEISFIVQEEFQKEFINHRKIKKIIYRPENLISEISGARLVITGRLHGALPAISLGTPVFFTQTIEDSRFSLLDYLEIKKFDINDSKIDSYLQYQLENPALCGSKETFNKVGALKNKFKCYVREILKKEKIIE